VDREGGTREGREREREGERGREREREREGERDKIECRAVPHSTSPSAHDVVQNLCVNLRSM